MPSQTKFAGTVADDATLGGTRAWVNPTNAQGAPDATSATMAVAAGSQHALKATNYGFAIPTDARIDGIVMTPYYSATPGTALIYIDATISLVRAGVVASSPSRSSAQTLPTAIAGVAHGGPLDNWDAAWTPADINLSTFGAAVRLQNPIGTSAFSCDAIAITVYYTRPQSELYVVGFRDAEPPHGLLFSEYVDGLRFGFKVRSAGQASMLIKRGSDNSDQLVALVQQGRPPMVTIEHPDGYLPFVGFVTLAQFTASDTHIQLNIGDHTTKLALGVTKTARSIATASGSLISDVLAEMQDRSAPALGLNLSHLKQGPSVNRELRMEKGDSFLRSMENDTNWEFFFSYAITPQSVETFVEFTERQGKDRRTEEALEEGVQLADVTLTYDFTLGAAQATSVGGTGAFPSRRTQTAKTAVRPIGGGGTIPIVQQTVNETNILQAQAQAALDAPENVARRISAQVVETGIDRSRFGVGDIRTFRLASAFLGTPVELVSRIIGIGMNPATGVHDIEAVEVP